MWFLTCVCVFQDQGKGHDATICTTKVVYTGGAKHKGGKHHECIARFMGGPPLSMKAYGGGAGRVAAYYTFSFLPLYNTILLTGTSEIETTTQLEFLIYILFQ